MNGYVGLSTGQVFNGKGVQEIPAGVRLIVETPGGAGIGIPSTRDANAIAADIRNGVVSVAAAARDYGYIAAGDD